jgi:hypothetical protein
VLQEKKLRIDGEGEAVRSETNEVAMQSPYSHQVNRSFRVLQSDIVRLNTLITQNRGMHQQLLQDTSVMETEFLQSLKEDELKSIQMQQQCVFFFCNSDQL